MSFYIPLTSNRSVAYFPGYTLTNFTTRLRNPFRLDGTYARRWFKFYFQKTGLIKVKVQLKCVYDLKKCFQIKNYFYFFD